MSALPNFPSIRPSLLMDFANSRRTHPLLTCTRASAATCFGPDGKLRTVGSNIPRIDYDPATGKCLGLLVEESRINAIRNNTMVGAVIGSPGVLPTNWVAGTPTNGLSREIVGVGSEDGIDYIDVRWSGTATAGTTGSVVAQFEPNTGIAATSEQTWSLSSNVRLVGGSLAGLNFVFLRCVMRDAAGANLGSISSSNLNVTGAPLALQRYFVSVKPTDVNTAFLSPFVSIGYSVGAVIDITLRIGLPQTELGANATSVIRTVGTAATRAADVITLPFENSGDITVACTWVEAGNKTGFLWQMDAAGSGSTRLRLSYTGSNDLQAIVTTSNTASTVTVAGPANISTGSNAVAVAFSPSAIAWGRNGVGNTAVNSRGALPMTSILRLGSSHGNTSQPNFRIARMSVYRSALTQAQLQRITAT